MKTGGQVREEEQMNPGTGVRAAVSKCPHCMVGLSEDI